jgi:hypothetical protein
MMASSFLIIYLAGHTMTLIIMERTCFGREDICVVKIVTVIRGVWDAGWHEMKDCILC